MPNIKLLQEAIQAFASGETKIADAKMRKFFVEQAQEINKKFDETFDADGQQDLLDDIRYDMGDLDDGEEVDVEFDDGRGAQGWIAQDENVPVREAEDDEVDVDVETDEVEDFEGDDVDSVDVDVESPEADKGTWTAIQGAFEELAELFKELDGQPEEVEDFESEVSVEDDGEEDEFADVDFGSDVRESAAGRLKKVASPAMKEEGGVNDKSPVAKRAPAFVDGVTEVKIKDGTVDLKTTKDSNMSDVDVTDNDNTMDNAKNLMKTVKEPKNSATNSKSPLPKRK